MNLKVKIDNIELSEEKSNLLLDKRIQFVHNRDKLATSVSEVEEQIQKLEARKDNLISDINDLKFEHRVESSKILLDHISSIWGTRVYVKSKYTIDADEFSFNLSGELSGYREYTQNTSDGGLFHIYVDGIDFHNYSFIIKVIEQEVVVDIHKVGYEELYTLLYEKSKLFRRNVTLNRITNMLRDRTS